MKWVEKTSKTGGGAGAGANRTNPWTYSMKIGFFAGLVWGAIRWLAAAMNFTAVPAAFLADPWVRRSALAGGWRQTAGFGLFILMSVIAALIYCGILRRLRGPAPGLLFGFAWWAVFYAGLGPWTGALPSLRKIGWNSLITDLCLFIAWGVFIGYSVSFEFHDEAQREPKPARS